MDIWNPWQHSEGHRILYMKDLEKLGQDGKDMGRPRCTKRSDCILEPSSMYTKDFHTLPALRVLTSLHTELEDFHVVNPGRTICKCGENQTLNCESLLPTHNIRFTTLPKSRYTVSQALLQCSVATAAPELFTRWPRNVSLDVRHSRPSLFKNSPNRVLPCSCATYTCRRSYKSLTPKTRALLGLGLMANAGLALQFSDQIESRLGLKPTSEEIDRVTPKLTIVGEGKNREEMSSSARNR